jgi:hypothetical protein
VGLEVPSGSPRYVNGREPISHPKVLARFAKVWSSMLTGIKQDFA